MRYRWRVQGSVEAAPRDAVLSRLARGPASNVLSNLFNGRAPTGSAVQIHMETDARPGP